MRFDVGDRLYQPQHYDSIDEVPQDIRKYWFQRYKIFSRYDEGIQLTDIAWYGVTPEPIACKIAEHVADAAPKNKKILIDAFAGAGGNTIAFAESGRWDQVFAIEKDPETLKCAKNNAEVYGVSKKIFFIEGDCFEVIKKRFASLGSKVVIFASPPWGGPAYGHDAIFDLNSMQPYNLESLYKPFAEICKEIVLFLPRTSDLNQLAQIAEPNRQIQAIQYCMQGASKALCVFCGDLVKGEDHRMPS